MTKSENAIEKCNIMGMQLVLNSQKKQLIFIYTFWTLARVKFYLQIRKKMLIILEHPLLLFDKNV